MQVLEIEEYIKPLNRGDKIQLMRDIAAMLDLSSDDAVFRRFIRAADAMKSRDCGPLEACTAATQLHELLKKEPV